MTTPLYHSTITTDRAEADRQEAAFKAEAVPIRELIMGRRRRMPDSPIFWVDASARPDVSDLARVHEFERPGDFVISSNMFLTADPLAMRVGWEIKMNAPVACSFHLYYDYLMNETWTHQIVAAGCFGVETSPPNADGDPPMSGPFVRFLLDQEVQLQFRSHLHYLDQTLAVIAFTEPHVLAACDPPPSLYHGRIWMAAAEPSGRVGRGKKAAPKPPKPPTDPTSN
jgi:hypothetical protein